MGSDPIVVETRVGERVLVQVDLESHVLDVMRIVKMTGKQRGTIEAPTSHQLRPLRVCRTVTRELDLLE